MPATVTVTAPKCTRDGGNIRSTSTTSADTLPTQSQWQWKWMNWKMQIKKRLPEWEREREGEQQQKKSRTMLENALLFFNRPRQSPILCFVFFLLLFPMPDAAVAVDAAAVVALWNMYDWVHRCMHVTGSADGMLNCTNAHVHRSYIGSESEPIHTHTHTQHTCDGNRIFTLTQWMHCLYRLRHCAIAKQIYGFLLCSLALPIARRRRSRHRHHRSPFVHQMQFYWLISVVFGVVNFYWGASSLPLPSFVRLSSLKNRFYFDDFSIQTKSTADKKTNRLSGAHPPYATIHCYRIHISFSSLHHIHLHCRPSSCNCGSYHFIIFLASAQRTHTHHCSEPLFCSGLLNASNLH